MRVHVVHEMGFIHNVGLIWKAGISKDDYYNQMDSKIFMTCTRYKLTPNLLPQSIILLITHLTTRFLLKKHLTQKTKTN